MARQPWNFVLLARYAFYFLIAGLAAESQGPIPEQLQAAAEKAERKAQRPEERPRMDWHGDPLPPGAIARLGTVRFRHEDMLGPFAISPDGQTLAAVPLLFGKSVAFWDISTGKLTRRLSFDHEVHYLAFTPDGKSIAVGAIETAESKKSVLRLFDLASGKETRQFVGHRPARNLFGDMDIWGAAFFTADGRRLVTLGGDSDVILWDAQSGKMVHQLNGSGWMVWGLSPDGKLFAARQQGSAKILRLFDGMTGKEIRQLSHPADVRSVAFSPDGQTLAVAFGGPDPRPGKIILWDLESGKERGTLAGHQAAVPALAFSPDGKVLASGAVDRTVRLWDLASKKELRKALYLSTRVSQLAFSRDGKTLISRGNENRVRLWDVATWQERLVDEGPAQAVEAVTYSPDGKLVACVSANGGIWLWEAATGKLVRTLPDGFSPVWFSADGRSLVSGGPGRDLHIWNLKNGEHQHTISLVGGLGGTSAISPDGKTLASWGHGPGILLWRTDSAKKLRILEVPSERPRARRSRATPWLFALCFSADGRTLYACSNETHVLRWDAATGASLPSIGKQEGGANGMALAPDGRSIATVTASGTLYLWEIATGQPRLVVKDAGHAAPVALSPDGRFLALADTKGEQVRLVRSADGQVIRRFTGHLGRIGALSFSPDGRTLASGGYDSTVLVWDVQDSVAADAKQTPALKTEKLAALWAGLLGEAEEAHRCMAALIASPTQSVPFLTERLQPVAAVDADRIARLLKELDSDQFRQREEAMNELRRLGGPAKPALRKVLHKKISLEMRRRVQLLLDERDTIDNASGERLRDLRAIEVLERIGDQSARELLRRLSEGADGAWLTDEAKATLQRLRKPMVQAGR